MYRNVRSIIRIAARVAGCVEPGAGSRRGAVRPHAPCARPPAALHTMFARQWRIAL